MNNIKSYVLLSIAIIAAISCNALQASYRQSVNDGIFGETHVMTTQEGYMTPAMQSNEYLAPTARSTQQMGNKGRTERFDTEPYGKPVTEEFRTPATEEFRNGRPTTETFR